MVIAGWHARYIDFIIEHERASADLKICIWYQRITCTQAKTKRKRVVGAVIQVVYIACSYALCTVNLHSRTSFPSKVAIAI